MTRHAKEKFGVLRRFGFEVDEESVIDAVRNPARVESRDDQYFAIVTFNSIHALVVIYERRKDTLVIITFYPVRRERYGI